MDNIEIKSEIKEEPMFSLKNFLKPSTKNVNIWCNSIKTTCIGLIAFSTTLIATKPTFAIIMIVLAIIVGGIAESVIFFTREKPVETLLSAVQDVKEEKMEQIYKEKEEEHVD